MFSPASSRPQKINEKENGKMNYIAIILVCFFSSVIGSVCGIGGGVIIKPVLDAMGIMAVTTISFLSGCTVLSMSVVSLYKSKKAKQDFIFDQTFATVLAVGGAAGGIAGKEFYQTILNHLPNHNQVGAIQAAVLMLVTAGTFIYSIVKERIHSKHLKNKPLIFSIGIALGIISSFLGIGSGPINLAVLFYCCSMTAKEAAMYSIYIIMFSQISSLACTLIRGTTPPFHPAVLVLMILCGSLGGLTGSRLNRKLDDHMVEILFMGVMGIIICINIYNIFRYW